RRGPTGYNKVGSVEGWASGAGMAKLARIKVSQALARGRGTTLAAADGDLSSLTARDVAVAADKGDLLARQIIRTTGKKLGEAMAILIDVLNPECIVVGGLAVRLKETLLKPARAVVKREALSGSANVCKIVCTALGETIGDVAALCVAVEGEK